MDDRSVNCPICGGWLQWDAANGEFLGCDTCDMSESEDRILEEGKAKIYFDIDGNWSRTIDGDICITAFVPEELSDENISALVKEIIYDHTNIIGGLK